MPMPPRVGASVTATAVPPAAKPLVRVRDCSAAPSGRAGLARLIVCARSIAKARE